MYATSSIDDAVSCLGSALGSHPVAELAAVASMLDTEGLAVDLVSCHRRLAACLQYVLASRRVQLL